MMTYEELRNAFRPGEEHPRAKYTEAQVAHAKRLLEDAPRVETFAPGTMAEIAKETGISMPSLMQIRYGRTWHHVRPAPAPEAEQRS